MNDQSDESNNKNFISGEKYCHDLPSICDCGVETAGVEDRTKKWSKSMSRALSGMVRDHQDKIRHKYSWVAKLKNEDSGMNCEGTLISSKYIVSAAHCTYNSHVKWKGFSPPGYLSVRITSSHFNKEITVIAQVTLGYGGEYYGGEYSGGGYFDVADYFVHEGYSYKKTVGNHPGSFIRPSSETALQDDIVLLELEKHVNLEIYTPVCLPRKKNGTLQWSKRPILWHLGYDRLIMVLPRHLALRDDGRF